MSILFDACWHCQLNHGPEKEREKRERKRERKKERGRERERESEQTDRHQNKTKTRKENPIAHVGSADMHYGARGEREKERKRERKREPREDGQTRKMASYDIYIEQLK